MFVFFFFFFQAEDGIRDYKVTGVQTCALPISLGGGATLVEFGEPAIVHGAAAQHERLEHDEPGARQGTPGVVEQGGVLVLDDTRRALPRTRLDRKSTRLNSSHLVISYAVFCLKKKKKKPQPRHVHIN